jgi:CrcB protein
MSALVWLYVALGGACGAMLRAAVSYWLAAGHYATLLINVLGAFLIGLCWAALQEQPWFAHWGRWLLVVGFLGGFTTFSTLAIELLWLLEARRWLALVALAVGSLALGLLAVIAGHLLGTALAPALPVSQTD